MQYIHIRLHQKRDNKILNLCLSLEWCFLPSNVSQDQKTNSMNNFKTAENRDYSLCCSMMCSLSLHRKRYIYLTIIKNKYAANKNNSKAKTV